MKKRILSIALCLLLAVGLLPMAALAADISTVSVSGLDHPVDGKTLDTSYTIPSGAGYAKASGNSSVTWYDQGTGGFKSVKSYGSVTGTKLDAGTKAASGHYYVAELRLERSGSNMFPKKEFSVTVSEDMGKRVMDKQGLSKSAANPSYEGAVYLYYKADLVYGDFNPIYLELGKDFNGYLLDGETQWTAADFTNVSWAQTASDFDLSVAWKQDGHALSAGEKFAMSRDYTLVLTFDAAKTTRHATFDAGDWYVQIDEDYLAVPTISQNGLVATAEFTFPCKNKLTELDITNIELPVAGQPMQTTGFHVAPAAVKSVEWFKYIGSIDAPASGNFEPNTTYYVKLTLAPSAGYAFVMDKSKVHAEQGDVTGYSLLDNGDAEVRIRFSVGEVPDILLSETEITINAPKLETAPSWLASADGVGYQVYDDDGGSYIGGVCWTDVTEDDSLTDDERVLQTHPDDEFRPGHTYQLSVELIAQDGYAFTESTAGVINGETTETMLQGEILRVTYTFAPLPILSALTVTESPAKTDYFVGESFDPTGLAVTASYGSALSKPVAVEDLTIEPSAALTEADKLVTLSYTDAEGVTQTATVEITVVKPKTLESIEITTKPDKTAYQVGESFDPAGMVVTAVYANGDIETVEGWTYAPDGALTEEDSFIEISYTEDEITKTASLAVDVEAKGKTVAKVALTVKAPKAGEKAAFTAALPENAKYVLEKISWYCDEDDLALAEGDAFGKKTYIFTATLLPEDGYAFAPDSELKGTLNGEDAQTRNIDDGKVLVTQYFALGNDNPFKDISESDYFYDAVMWAYYADPQVTTGIHADEFGPYSTVKRGQAVTFLWRAMGCPEPETTENPFEDVKENQYYYKAVLWAVEQGITKGTSETKFSPMQDLSTAHIITFLYRTLNPGEDGWYQEARAWAKGAGLLKDLDIEVKPGENCPRCDVVLFLYRELAK